PAASVWVEKGENITIRGCKLHDSANGLFISSLTRDALVERCWIYGNGVERSIFQHNSYTEAAGMIFQFNRIGPLRPGCPGNNIKLGSAGRRGRCNRIEGCSRELDLVDAEDSPEIRADPRYRSALVFGNVIIEREADGNNQIVHYGGDSGKLEWYRKGTLRFF